ncbi:hypothetical protein [Nonomuraea recticatena]|uniref:hypothetical protein n=1 Tax=Nonomuraea recticatena TaxID=46178 RepID=UPI0031F74E47
MSKKFDTVNKVGPVPDEVLRPLLAGASYLVDVVGPHATLIAEANAAPGQGRRAEVYGSAAARRRGSHPAGRAGSLRQAVSEAGAGQISSKIKLGWDRGDPLLEVSLRELSEPFGYRRLHPELVELLHPRRTHPRGPFQRESQLRPHRPGHADHGTFLLHLEDALERVGAEHPWAREAALVPRAGDGQEVSWTEPLGYTQLLSLRAVLLTAAGMILFALTDMRSSEAAEIVVGSCQEPSHTVGGGRRFRLAGKVIKHRQCALRRPVGSLSPTAFLSKPLPERARRAQDARAARRAEVAHTMFPGFVDTHLHAVGAPQSSETWAALLRQGIDGDSRTGRAGYAPAGGGHSGVRAPILRHGRRAATNRTGQRRYSGRPARRV